MSLACTEQNTCIETNSWEVGIAFGLGVKTNPLVDGDNIPLVILPDLAWYGEKAYFDNAELGYQWLNQPELTFETYLNIDQERAFFSFLHPSNFVLPLQNIGVEAPIPNPAEDLNSPQPNLSINEIASRKWAFNAGARVRWFMGQSQLHASFESDINGVHSGYKIDVQYRYPWLWQDMQWGLSLGNTWKSRALIDYYYGISERDTQIASLHFTGKAGWQPYISLSMQKPINQKWSWLANIGYRALPDSLTASPIVHKDNVSNFFIGVAYRY